MSYIYNKSYKDLLEKEFLLEEEIGNFLKSLPDNESILEKFEEYKKTNDSRVDMIESEIQDAEWDHESDMDDKDDEIDRLKSEIEDLENKIEKSGFILEKSTLDDEMKIELFEVAAKKFTLTQLEEKLGGNKFQLM
jgi:predicted  nucleic acid-binding Zn-ribbon protein